MRANPTSGPLVMARPGRTPALQQQLHSTSKLSFVLLSLLHLSDAVATFCLRIRPIFVKFN